VNYCPASGDSRNSEISLTLVKSTPVFRLQTNLNSASSCRYTSLATNVVPFVNSCVSGAFTATHTVSMLKKLRTRATYCCSVLESGGYSSFLYL
jgi:hypothetical protein